MKTLLHTSMTAIATLLLGVVSPTATAAEVPSLQADVDAGRLPPKAQRLPDNPRVIELARALVRGRGLGGQSNLEPLPPGCEERQRGSLG